MFLPPKRCFCLQSDDLPHCLVLSKSTLVSASFSNRTSLTKEYSFFCVESLPRIGFVLFFCVSTSFFDAIFGTVTKNFYENIVMDERTRRSGTTFGLREYRDFETTTNTLRNDCPKMQLHLVIVYNFCNVNRRVASFGHDYRLLHHGPYGL